MLRHAPSVSVLPSTVQIDFWLRRKGFFTRRPPTRGDMPKERLSSSISTEQEANNNLQEAIQLSGSKQEMKEGAQDQAHDVLGALGLRHEF